MVSPRGAHVTGAAVEYVVVPAARVAPEPQTLSTIEAASLVTSGTTALRAVRDMTAVRENGADEVLDYHTTVAPDIGPFDVVVDAVGRELLAYRRRPTGRGRMVTVDFGSAAALASIAVSGVFGARRIRAFSGNPDHVMLTELAEYVRSGAVRPVVGQVYPLDRIAEAQRLKAAPPVRVPMGSASSSFSRRSRRGRRPRAVGSDAAGQSWSCRPTQR